MIKYPPIKYKIPQNIVSKKFDYNNLVWDYKLYAFKDKNAYLASVMTAQVRLLPPNNKYNPTSKNIKSLYISFIRSFDEGKYFGLKMLNLARIESKKLDCNGNMHLEATSLLSKTRHSPHRMYRKFGFSSTDKDKLKIIDKWVKTNKTPNWITLESTPMYYHSKEKQPNYKIRLLNIFNKITKLFT